MAKEPLSGYSARMVKSKAAHPPDQLDDFFKGKHILLKPQLYLQSAAERLLTAFNIQAVVSQ